jgi:hypothetical protein
VAPHRYAELGYAPLGQDMDTVPNTPEQFAERIRAHLPRWGKVIKAAAIISS